MIGHVAPEAAVGGPIAAIADGDLISIDVNTRRIDVEKVDLGQRLKGWSVPESKYRSGVFAKYAAQVQSASEGAVTRP